MKPSLMVFFAVVLLTFAVQVIFDIVILQITFGFPKETFVWQLISSALIGLLAWGIAAQISKPRSSAAN